MTLDLNELQKLLGEALEPFAAASGRFDDDHEDGAQVWKAGRVDYLTVGDFRRAASAKAALPSLLERLAKAEEERDAAQARVAVLEGYLRTILDIDREAPEFGLCDCIDNEGEHYKSADLESVLIDARQALEPTHD